jgi:hypothetical protein
MAARAWPVVVVPGVMVVLVVWGGVRRRSRMVRVGAVAVMVVPVGPVVRLVRVVWRLLVVPVVRAVMAVMPGPGLVVRPGLMARG